jgi:hypothetical protein|tara:strand:- start:1749 stop:2402 length:654 start_codon:yes stop_codon:yes gene_type:complete
LYNTTVIIKTNNMEEDLFYGNISYKMKEKSKSMDEDLERFYDKYTNDIYLYPDLYKTALEIDLLINKIELNLIESDVYYQMDIDLKSYLKKVSLEKGINEKEFNHILKYLDKIAPLIIRLKEYWNRARPYQYANLIEAPLYPMTTFSGHSPAYPSGHTLQGYVWARLITTIKPELKEWSESIATKINLSRIALGVHFPSDIDFSKKIYKDIVSSKLI